MSRSAADATMLAHSRALGDPTRNAIFTYLRDAGRPVGVAELTEHLGCNHNAVRQHLAKLRDAGLVLEEVGPRRGPGRPPLQFRPNPGAAERWGGGGPHEALSLLLVEMLRTGEPARAVGARAGARLAAAADPGTSTIEVLLSAARSLGFEPRELDTARGTDVVLDRCPFVGPASDAPDVVCELHRGMAEGIAAAADDGARIAELVVKPARRAGCRIEVTHTG